MDVVNNERLGRYELLEEDRVVAVADYEVRGDIVVFPHTEVARDRRGRGLGDVVVRAALDDVRASGRRIVAACWFVEDFIERNREYADLVGE